MTESNSYGLTPEETILAQMVETFWEDGDLKTWALLLDVTGMTLVDHSGPFDAYDWHATLWVLPETLSRIDDELIWTITPRLIDVAASNGKTVSNVVVKRRLPRVSSGWREMQESRLSATQVSNQARAIQNDPTYPRDDNLTFRSQAEVRVYRALERLQASAPEDRRFGVFPLPSGRTTSGTILEPDFLITVNKRAGIIEVDGPHHRRRFAADVSRDRLWRGSGVPLTERILVEDTTDDAELDRLIATFIKQVANA